MKTLTTENIINAAAYAVENPDNYNQSSWCGTACCVLGHARRLAGSDQPNSGPRDGEIIGDDTPRGRMIRTMLNWTHESTAALIPHVRDDGSILVPAGIPGVGAYADIRAGAHIGVGAIIGARAHIGADADIGADATIGADAIIRARADIRAGAHIGVGAIIGARAHIGDGAHIGAGAHIGDYADIGAGETK